MGKESVRVESVRLKNFMSFYDATVNLGPGLTIIVGPTGAGKSSIFHAMKFALGSNQRDDRYERWSDFVRMGARSAEAEVAIRRNGTVVKFSRRVDSDGVPRAYVGGKRARASELRRAVETLGLDVDNPLVFMPQGRVTALKDASPEEVRRLVEEGTGLDSLRDRILLQEAQLEQDKSKLIETVAEADAVNSELRMLESDLRRLERKRELQRQRHLLEQEMKWARLESLLVSIQTAKQQLEEQQAGLVELMEKRNRVQYEIAEVEREEGTLGEQLNTVQREIGGIDSHLRAKQEELERTEKGTAKAVEEIRELEKRLADDESELARVKDHLERSVSARQDLSQRLKQLELEHQYVEQEREKLDEQLAAFAKWNEERMRAQTALVRIRDQHNSKEILLRALKDRLRQLKAEYEALENRWREVWETLEKTTEADLAEEKRRLEDELSRLNETRFREASRQADLEKEIERLRARLSEESERVPPAVRELKRAVDEHSLQTVEGPLVEILGGREDLATPAEAVLENDLVFAFIVEDYAEYQLLRTLRDDIEAPAPIVLINSADKIDEQPHLPSNKRVRGWLWDLLGVPPNIVDCLRRAFGDYVLTTDPRTAESIAREMHVGAVTMGGSVFRTQGKSVISYPKIEGPSYLSAAPLRKRLRAAERELKTARKTVQQIETEVMQVAQQRERVLALMTQMSRWSESWNRRQEILEAIPATEQEIAQVSAALEDLRPELQRAQQQLRELDGSQPPERSKIVGELAAVRAKTKRLEREISDVRADLRVAEETMNQKRRQLDALRESIDMLRASVTESRQKVKEAQDQAAQILELLDNLEEQRESLQRQADVIRERIEDKRKTIRRLSKDLAELDLRLKSGKVQLGQVRSQLDRMERERESLEKELQGSDKPTEVRNLEIVRGELARVTALLDDYRDVNESVAVTEAQLQKKLTELKKRIDEIREELSEADATLASIRAQYRNEMSSVLRRLEDQVNSVLKTIKFDAEIRLDLVEEDGSYGVNFKSRIRGGELRNIRSGSGGERSLFVIALILALGHFNPAPLYAFDEVDIYLDSVYTDLVGRLFKEAAKKSQILLITPAKSTHLLKHADRLIGVVSPGKKNPSVVIEGPDLHDEDESSEEMKN
ncbi:MAG: AAA family ATPase [Candidatus Thorarchaeota archaeon]